MSRAYAQIFKDIWNDEDFRTLEPGPQRLYMFLLSQPNLNYAGVLPLNPRRWASRSKGLTVDQVMHDLQILTVHRYVLVDEEEEEVLIRSFIRNDGVWRNPKTLKSARRDAMATGSRPLRRALIEELERLPLADLPGNTRAGITSDVKGLLESLRQGVATPSLGGSDGVATPSADHRQGPGAGAGVGEVVEVVDSSLVENQTTPPPGPPRADPETKKDAPPRADVERLCARLADRLTANGVLKRDTKITQGWRDEARRLIDIDNVPLTEALTVLDWCQRDGFWAKNVQSLPTFRKQYSRLRMQAREAGALAPAGSQEWDDRYDETTRGWDV